MGASNAAHHPVRDARHPLGTSGPHRGRPECAEGERTTLPSLSSPYSLSAHSPLPPTIPLTLLPRVSPSLALPSVAHTDASAEAHCFYLFSPVPLLIYYHLVEHFQRKPIISFSCIIRHICCFSYIFTISHYYHSNYKITNFIFERLCYITIQESLYPHVFCIVEKVSEMHVIFST